MKHNGFILKKHIPLKEIPHSKYYKECHDYATKKEIKKFGLHRFRKLGIFIARHPTELLGTNKEHRRRWISLIVPKEFWEEVDFHEKTEADCIARKKRQEIRKHTK